MGHRRLHSTEHQDGGVDELNVGGLSGVLADRQDADKLQGRDVQDVAPSDDDVLTWNDTESRWEPAAPTGGGGGVFGEGFTEASSEGESSSTTLAWIEKLSMTTPTVSAGKYRIGWSYEFQTTSSSMTGKVRIQQDDTTEVCDVEFRVTPDSGWIGQAGFKYLTLGSGSYTFDMDFAPVNGGKAMQLRRARLEFWRVS